MNRKLKSDELGRISVSEFREAEKLPIIVILDNIRSLHNVGSVFRTCDAFRVSALYLCGITAQPPHREIQKTALGSTESVIWKYFESTVNAVQYLTLRGYDIVCIEQTNNSLSLSDYAPSGMQPLALVFGNEIVGVSQDVILKTTCCVEIPQFGTKHSFNIAVTVGIVLWDIAEKIKSSTKF